MSQHEELPTLDESELAMLAAFQAEETPSSAVVHDVRARLLETTAVAPPTGSIIKGPWLPWAGATALAAAAAAVLALNLGGADATAVGQRAAQQAVDTRESTGREERVIAKEKATRTRSGANARAPEPVAQPEAAPIMRPEPAPSERSARKPPVKRRPAVPAPSVDVVDPAFRPESSLAAETRMLDRARKAVASKRPKDALTILTEAASKFPRGVLAQERAALRVVALCDAGRVDAGRNAAASFVVSYPRSALRARVESACPETP